MPPYQAFPQSARFNSRPRTEGIYMPPYQAFPQSARFNSRPRTEGISMFQQSRRSPAVSILALAQRASTKNPGRYERVIEVSILALAQRASWVIAADFPLSVSFNSRPRTEGITNFNINQRCIDVSILALAQRASIVGAIHRRAIWRFNSRPRTEGISPPPYFAPLHAQFQFPPSHRGHHNTWQMPIYTLSFQFSPSHRGHR